MTYDQFFSAALARLHEERRYRVFADLEHILLGVWDGSRGTQDRKSVEELLSFTFESDFFYVRNPDVTVRDVAKMPRLSGAVSELLDVAT